jgi:hypothetical protein
MQQEMSHNDVEQENILQNTIVIMEAQIIAVKRLQHDVMERVHELHVLRSVNEEHNIVQNEPVDVLRYRHDTILLDVTDQTINVHDRLNVKRIIIV